MIDWLTEWVDSVTESVSGASHSVIFNSHTPSCLMINSSNSLSDWWWFDIEFELILSDSHAHSEIDGHRHLWFSDSFNSYSFHCRITFSFSWLRIDRWRELKSNLFQLQVRSVTVNQFDFDWVTEKRSVTLQIKFNRWINQHSCNGQSVGIAWWPVTESVTDYRVIFDPSLMSVAVQSVTLSVFSWCMK